MSCDSAIPILIAYISFDLIFNLKRLKSVTGISNDIEGHKNEAYIRLIGVRQHYQDQKIKAMFFNKQNITLHGLHVHDGASFLVGFLCRCCSRIRHKIS